MSRFARQASRTRPGGYMRTYFDLGPIGASTVKIRADIVPTASAKDQASQEGYTRTAHKL